MDARKKPYWPHPGQPSSRFNELIAMGKLVDTIWRGQYASYRHIDKQGRVRVASWPTIKKLYLGGID